VGISTIDEKLESICAHYHVMNELMGVQAFINPWFKVDAQADNKTATLSLSEPAGNKIRSSEMESNNDYLLYVPRCSLTLKCLDGTCGNCSMMSFLLTCAIKLFAIVFIVCLLFFFFDFDMKCSTLVSFACMRITVELAVDLQ
ncbi:hypothetical protein VP01_6333g1, partial [Puccinia sorghi]